ncbi:hypothetical protein BC828DRAFT_436546 [Blastocladiella britannica]|nr:hypothetical protein BC828DRAFT_436546 [Blastocladiella britannica]
MTPPPVNPRSLRAIAPVLVENALVAAALAVSCPPDASHTPYSAFLSSTPACHAASVPWWAWAAVVAATAADVGLERRRLARLAPPPDRDSDVPSHPPPPPPREWPLESATRAHASAGLIYGTAMIPALLARSSYASFVSHAVAWQLLGSLGVAITYLTRIASPRTAARLFQLALVLHLLTPSNPWTVVALALTTAPALLHSMPRAFSLGEALALATGLVLVADSFRARPTHAHVVVAAMQHLALGSAAAAAVAAPVVKRLRSLDKGKTPLSDGGRRRARSAASLYAVIAAVIVGGVTPLMYLRSGVEPWTWVVGYIISSPAHSVMIGYWIGILALAFFVFPWHRSSNAQRKAYHLLAIAIVLPGYVWTPVFTSLALTVALSAFTFAEMLRVSSAPPLGPLLQIALAPFRDIRDESFVLTSHMHLLLGIALPVWTGVIEGTWRSGLAGMAALGVGDALASVIGRRAAERGVAVRWHAGTTKTVQGSAGFVGGTLLFFAALGEPLSAGLVVAVLLTGAVEAVSSQFDNFVVPMVMLLAVM